MSPSRNLRKRSTKRRRSTQGRGELTSSPNVVTALGAFRNQDISPMRVPRTRSMVISQAFDYVTILFPAGAFAPGSCSFTLNSLPQASSMTTLFDKYRFLQVIVVFTPTFTVSNSTTSYPGRLTTVLDYDDAVVPASTAALYNYDTKQQCEGTQVCRRVLRPRPAIAAYSGAFTSFATPSQPLWINSASPGVQHYGVKYVLDQYNVATVTSASYNVTAEFIIEFSCQI